MTSYIALELRKNRTLFIGMGCAFLLSMPFAAMLSTMSDYSAAQALNAALLFWTLAGLPGITVLFGASGGAGLRAEPVREAEALLPVSPRKKAAAAVLAGGIHLLLLALLVLLVSFVVSPAWRETLLSQDNWVKPTFLRTFFAMTLFTIAYLLVVSFTCAYAFKQAIIGGFLGVLFAGPAVAALGFGFSLIPMFGYRAPFADLGTPAIVIALAGGGLALAHTAPWVERRPKEGWKKGLLIAAALAAGSVASVGALSFTFHRLTGALYMVSDFNGFRSWTERRRDLTVPVKARRAASHGALLKSLAGKLVWITPEGERTTLIQGQRRTLMNIVHLPWWDNIVSVAWDKEGILWALVRVPEDRKAAALEYYQLWHGRPTGLLSLHTSISRRPSDPRPFRLAHRGPELGMLAWGPAGESNLYAALPEKGGRPRWSPMGDNETEFLSKGWEGSGNVITLSADKRTLVRKSPDGTIRRCRLPGRVLLSYHEKIALPPNPPLHLSFVVDLGEGRRARSICHPDGTVATGWHGDQNTFYRLENNADESLWGWRNGTTLHLVTPDNTHVPPVAAGPALQKLGTDSKHARVVHVTRSNAWLIADDRFLAMLDNTSGKLLKIWGLPKSQRRRSWHEDETVQLAEGGLFFHTGRELYFISWDGAKKNLGAA
ncbi:MAG: hypothetical protein ABII00_17860 [Elusimicrobiota bacterium]